MRALGDRGQSTVIGVIILFGFLVVAFSTYQATVVPDQNANVEYQHSQQVADQMVGLRGAILNTAGTGNPHAQRITLGTSYPPRIVAVNPGPVSGTIRSVTQGQYEITDIQQQGNNQNTATPVEDACGYDATTKALAYRASYSEYKDAPTLVYENSIAYRDFESGYRIDTTQILIHGDTIQLAPLTGNLSVSRTNSISPSILGGEQNTETIQSPNSNFNFTIPTQLPAAVWENNSQLFDRDDNPDETPVVDVRQAGSGTVEAEIEQGTYTLVCRPVSVNAAPPA